MASVYERYNVKGIFTSWEYAVSNYPFPTIRKAGFKTAKDAKKAAALVEETLKNKKIIRRNLKNKYERLPFHLEFEIWFYNKKAKMDEKTKKSFITIRNKIEDFFQDQHLVSITSEKYQLFLNSQSHNTVATNDKLHARISKFANYALTNGKIIENFTLNAVITGTSKKGKKEYLTINEYSTIMKHLLHNEGLNLQFKTMVVFALSTGVRYGELCGICWDDIDFEKQTIRIHRQWDYVNGSGFKGLKDTSLNKGDDNNIKERTIPLNNQLKKLLHLYKHSLYYLENADNRLFYKANCKAKVISNNTFNKKLHAFLSSLNIDKITAHSLRHSFATYQVYKKIEKEYLQFLMGHVDFRTTEKYYIHFHKEMYTDEASKFLEDNDDW